MFNCDYCKDYQIDVKTARTNRVEVLQIGLQRCSNQCKVASTNRIFAKKVCEEYDENSDNNLIRR